METRTTILIIVFVFGLMLIDATLVRSQSSPVPHTDTLLAEGSKLRLPRTPIHPALIRLHSLEGTLLVDSVDYVFIDRTHIQLLKENLRNNYIILKEKTLTPILTRPATWIDTQLIKSDYLLTSVPGGLESEASFPSWSNVSYSGHFGRGINIGNNQNTTLNSNFDLQLKGFLPHGIEVIGSLSDNSIPIQPEGNSQRLQEFDKVFIQLRKNNALLVAGDHEIRNPVNHFMHYYKKTKGVYGNFSTQLATGWKQNTSLNYSVSKGKFKRTNLTVEEGNQGPYRLAQESNNLFVVVLAGTEKVYLDGHLLERGELNDYTIDYNLGEITFTPQIYISATSRIVVEYEFAEQNYLRSLVAGHSTWERNNWKMGIHVYSEQDGKNAFQNNILTPENEAVLAEAGDQVEGLKGTSVVPWEGGFEEGVVLYRLMDTMGFQRVLSLVKQPVEEPLYTAAFSYVGKGNGDYEPQSAYTNGEVYRWVAPDPDGSHNGSYAPVTRLQAPQKQQMFGFNVRKVWGPQMENMIFSEWSLTNKDLNRFSELGDGDDAGWAQFSGFSWGRSIDTSRQQAFRIEGNMEWRKSSFRPVSNYRPVEFDRNWNYLSSTINPKNEQLYGLTAQYQDRDFLSHYKFQSFNAGSDYTGLRHDLNFDWTPGNLDFNIDESITLSQTSEVNSFFSRPEAIFSWRSTESEPSLFTAGYQGEYNAIRDKTTDSLTVRSQRFDKVYTSFQWKKSQSLTLSTRIDYKPGNDSFMGSFRTNDIRLQSEIAGDKNYIRWIGTIRHLKVIGDYDIIPKDQKGWNVLSQLIFSQRWFKEGWHNQGEIALSNGKEPRRQFQYIKVETGNGQYKYVDLNKDSIQQLNEFFPAIYPDERNYIRVSTLENALISTFNYQFKWSWNINLSKWTDQAFWSKWSTENSILINNKQQRSGRIKLWNIPDSDLVSSRINVLTNLYFNRNGKILQQHFGYWVRKQKDFLNTGFEAFDTRECFSKSTILFTSQINSLLELKRRNVRQAATSFEERNFRIKAWEGSHIFRWMLNQKMQLEYKTGFIRGVSEKIRAKASIWSNKISWQYKPDLKWSANTSFDFSRVLYESEEQNYSLEQIMLQGLRSGQNLLWELSLQRRLPNNLVISLRYNGRRTGKANVIHTGLIQANLLF